MAAFDETTDYVCTWFDRELKQVFDFDVYGAAFDPTIGHATYEARDADILLIRLEDLSRRGPAALEDFLGVRDVEILTANEGAEKTTRDVYRAVRDRLTLPELTLDSVYGSRYARHFYAVQEIEGLKARWRG